MYTTENLENYQNHLLLTLKLKWQKWNLKAEETIGTADITHSRSFLGHKLKEW